MRKFSCFGAPVLDPRIAEIRDDGGKGYVRWPGGSQADSAADPDAQTKDAVLDYILTIDADEILGQLSARETDGMARFIPSLLCGEESAVIIFDHERRRYGRAKDDRISAALGQIALEEERHELMLRGLADYLPQPDDIDEIHRRAKSFFFKLGFKSPDPLQRLNLIGALDRCVCITLGDMIKRASVTRIPAFGRIVRRILEDEARHVRICRRIMAELGVTKPDMEEAAVIVREMFVDMMGPVGDSFEHIGLDPDRLFASILRHEIIEVE
ncbi:MAG: ferritin-like domain-containing protein [Alphaproteobacteria bacterium]